MSFLCVYSCVVGVLVPSFAWSLIDGKGGGSPGGKSKAGGMDGRYGFADAFVGLIIEKNLGPSPSDSSSMKSFCQFVSSSLMPVGCGSECLLDWVCGAHVLAGKTVLLRVCIGSCTCGLCGHTVSSNDLHSALLRAVLM